MNGLGVTLAGWWTGVPVHSRFLASSCNVPGSKREDRGLPVRRSEPQHPVPVLQACSSLANRDGVQVIRESRARDAARRPTWGIIVSSVVRPRVWESRARCDLPSSDQVHERDGLAVHPGSPGLHGASLAFARGAQWSIRFPSAVRVLRRTERGNRVAARAVQQARCDSGQRLDALGGTATATDAGATPGLFGIDGASTTRPFHTLDSGTTSEHQVVQGMRALGHHIRGTSCSNPPSVEGRV